MAGEREVSVIIRAKSAVADGLSSAKGAITSWAGSINGLVGNAFAGLSLGAFAKRAVDEVSGAERAASQLANTLSNIGVDAGKVRPEIDAAVASLQKVAAIDDDDAIASLNKLVQISGDYRKSLANLPLVADVAAAKNIDLADAAELVGKVMAGTGAKGLKAFGITTTDAAAAIEELRAKVKGAAETELGTLGGSLKAANVAFGDVAQAVGEVVAASPGFQQFMRQVIGGMRDAAGWLTTHKSMLGSWLATLIDVARRAGEYISHIVGFWVNLGVVVGGVIELMSHPFDSARRADALRDIQAGASGIKEEIAGAWDAVTRSAAKAADTQTAGLKRTREELEKNRRAHEALLAAQKAEADAEAAKKAAAERSELDRSIDKRIADAIKAGEATGGWDVALAQLRLTERATTESLKNGNIAIDRRLVLLDRLAAIQVGRKKLGDPTLAKSPLEALADAAGKESDRPTAPAPVTPIPPVMVNGLGMAAGIGTELAKQAELLRGAGAAWDDLGTAIGAVAAGPMLQFGESMAMAMGALIVGSKSAGQAFKSAMLSALGSVAKAEGDFFVGKAIAAAGEGLLGNPFAIFAQGKFLLAAGAMYAVAGGAAAVANAGGGGGGGGGGGTGGNQGGIYNPLGIGGGSTTVILKGRKFLLDTRDPDDQDAFKEMLKKLSGNREQTIVFEDG